MKDNTPAFPQHHVDNDPRNAEPFHYMDGGMTLRDYFAAEAVRALVNHGTPYSKIAREAYALADEMMEARK